MVERDIVKNATDRISDLIREAQDLLMYDLLGQGDEDVDNIVPCVDLNLASITEARMILDEILDIASNLPDYAASPENSISADSDPYAPQPVMPVTHYDFVYTLADEIFLTTDELLYALELGDQLYAGEMIQLLETLVLDLYSLASDSGMIRMRTEMRKNAHEAFRKNWFGRSKDDVADALYYVGEERLADMLDSSTSFEEWMYVMTTADLRRLENVIPLLDDRMFSDAADTLEVWIQAQKDFEEEFGEVYDLDFDDEW